MACEQVRTLQGNIYRETLVSSPSPEIELMHCFIIQIRRVAEFQGSGLAVMLLFVQDIMFRTSYNTSILDPLNSLRNCNTGQDWIGTESFPVSSAFRYRPRGPATGPNWTSTPLPRCSDPIALPRVFMSRVLHVAATFTPAGKAEL